MAYNPGGCVSTYNRNYSDCVFKTGGTSLATSINTAAVDAGINPATLATIFSLETGGTSDPKNSKCSPCDTSGAGVCQISKLIFNAWNS